ncbi:hypothetical protein ACFL52_04685, partial [Candidatus Margulisiibacteriota bacterium]
MAVHINFIKRYVINKVISRPAVISNNKLLTVQPEEIAVARRDAEFGRIHGHTEKIVIKLKELIGDPKEATEVINNKYGVVFIMRRSGRNNKVWAFKKLDLPKVAKLLEIGYDEEILKVIDKSKEIAIAQSDKAFLRIHGETHKIINKLKELIGDPEEATEVINDKYGVVFTRRYAKGRRRKVWTFKKLDLPKVAKLLEVGCDEEVLKVIDKSKEIAVAKNDH